MYNKPDCPKFHGQAFTQPFTFIDSKLGQNIRASDKTIQQAFRIHTPLFVKPIGEIHTLPIYQLAMIRL